MKITSTLQGCEQEFSPGLCKMSDSLQSSFAPTLPVWQAFTAEHAPPRAALSARLISQEKLHRVRLSAHRRIHSSVNSVTRLTCTNQMFPTPRRGNTPDPPPSPCHRQNDASVWAFILTGFKDLPSLQVMFPSVHTSLIWSRASGVNVVVQIFIEQTNEIIYPLTASPAVLCFLSFHSPCY